MFGAAAASAAAADGGHPTAEATASNFPHIAARHCVSGCALVKPIDVVLGDPIAAIPALEIFAAVGDGFSPAEGEILKSFEVKVPEKPEIGESTLTLLVSLVYSLE